MTTSAANPTSEAFFEQKYQASSDPWNFATDSYEQSRYAAILQALSGTRYCRAFEPGCSIGILTAGLAPLCDQLLSLDISPTAVEKARQRCHAFPQVTITQGALPAQLPSGSFDLIVLSEIGYYFEETVLAQLADILVHQLSPHGTLLAAHWLGTSPDHILTGDHVHEVLGQTTGLHPLHAERHPSFRLDTWRHTS